MGVSPVHRSLLVSGVFHFLNFFTEEVLIQLAVDLAYVHMLPLKIKENLPMSKEG